MEKAVDFFDHPYYKLAKTMTSLVGLWPNQTTKELIIYRGCLFTIISLQLTPQFIAAYTYRNDLKILLDTLSPFIVDSILVIKFVNNCFHSKTLVHLLDLIKDNWTIFPNNNGQQLLHYHSDFCRKASLIWLVAVYLGTLSFATEPLQRKLLYPILYNNMTVPKSFALPMEFGPLDVDYWYYPLLLASTCFIFVFMTVVGSCDLLLFLYAEHAVGLFKGLGYAIEHLPASDSSHKGDFTFEYLRSCAVTHSRAIYFAEHVRDIYLWTFFGVIGLNMVMLSITGVQVVVNQDAMEKVIKYTVFVVMQSAHLFVECYAAQRLMDASFELKETLTNAAWYDTSPKTQKLIPLMLMRSQSPIVLTAGKMIVMNMDTFAVVKQSNTCKLSRKISGVS